MEEGSRVLCSGPDIVIAVMNHEYLWLPAWQQTSQHSSRQHCGPMEVGWGHAGPWVNVGVPSEYDQVCDYSQVQSFDGMIVILMAAVCHSKGIQVTVRHKKQCVEQSPVESRWEWGMATLAALFQESCGQCSLLTTAVITCRKQCQSPTPPWYGCLHWSPVFVFSHSTR